MPDGLISGLGKWPPLSDGFVSVSDGLRATGLSGALRTLELLDTFLVFFLNTFSLFFDLDQTDMAASPSDFLWYNDVDDDYPIGQGPTDTSTASTPVDPITPSSSTGPADRVRQLRGQPKVSINTSLTGKLPTAATKVVSKTRRKSTRKRSHPEDELPPARDLKAKKAQAAAICLDSDPEMEEISDNQGSNSDDDGDPLANDKCVSRSSVIHISMIY
jgi:hypothetical protein